MSWWFDVEEFSFLGYPDISRISQAICVSDWRPKSNQTAPKYCQTKVAEITRPKYREKKRKRFKKRERQGLER